MISKLFQITLFFFATIFLVSAQQDSYIDMFVPDFGIVPGTNKQNGTCEGFEGIRIDCECPPSKGDFTKALKMNVNNGYAGDEKQWPVKFSAGHDELDHITRINAFIATLQNIKGDGQGCSVFSTNLTALFASHSDSSSTMMPYSTSMLMPIPTSTMSSSTSTMTTPSPPYP